MQDPIGDMIVCIKNSQLSKKLFLYTDYSNFKKCILRVLWKEGYIAKYEIISISNNKKNILIYLKYFKGLPVISEIVRVSKPSLRIYKSCKDIPFVISGFGIIIVSTSSGVMSDKKARKDNLGGEIICYVK